MLLRQRWEFAVLAAAGLLFVTGPGRADEESEFRRLCQMDTSAEKCDCYLGSLQEALSPQDYSFYLGAMMANARTLDRGIVLSPHLASLEGDSQDLRQRISRASDHGMTACSIDYHE